MESETAGIPHSWCRAIASKSLFVIATDVEGESRVVAPKVPSPCGALVEDVLSSAAVWGESLVSWLREERKKGKKEKKLITLKYHLPKVCNLTGAIIKWELEHHS